MILRVILSVEQNYAAVDELCPQPIFVCIVYGWFIETHIVEAKYYLISIRFIPKIHVYATFLLTHNMGFHLSIRHQRG